MKSDMQNTADIANYDAIIAGGSYTRETRLNIAGVDYVEGDHPLYQVITDRKVFSGSSPEIGACPIGEINIVMKLPLEEIPRMAEIKAYARVRNSQMVSGWLPKGVFYLNERTTNEQNDRISIYGCDAMAFADAPYPSSSLAWPAKDRQVLEEVAAAIGVEIDESTLELIPAEGRYSVQFPAEDTMRDAIGTIAALYAGNFIINETGKLQLVGLNNLPAETNYLINEKGDYITFGGVRILRS